MNGAYGYQTELGRRYDATSHEIGKWLQEAQLKGTDGKPCGDGWDFVTTRPSRNDGTYFYVWHIKRTMERLLKYGHAPKVALSEKREGEESGNQQKGNEG
jgi:hypothetical protein